MTNQLTIAPPATTTSVLELIDKSRACLLSACRSQDVDDRFRNAQLASLRAAAAVLAARTAPAGRSRPRSAWDVLRLVAPEFGEWADFFAASGRRLQLAERGSVMLSYREADDLVREAEGFLGLVLAGLGLPISAPVEGLLAPTRHSSTA